MSGFFDTVRSTSEFVNASRSAFDDDGAKKTRGVLASAVDNVEDFFRAAGTLSIKDAPAFIDAIRNLNGIGIDDREFLLEKLVLLMSTLPEDSSLGKKLQQTFIDALYKDLPHPPASFLGPINNSAPSTSSEPEKPIYAFRTDDGSGYNPMFPSLGKAGTPYARTVPAFSTVPASALPDPGLVFDLLLKRDPKGDFKPHPGGLSAMFFGVANLVIHSIFDTDHRDWRINNTSSYMDLSPLYGGNAGYGAKTVLDMRCLDGSGKIWADTFADHRLLYMPPATAVVLILLNRNHNHVAQMIYNINEQGIFKDPAQLDDAGKRKQDDEIFHRARLVNSGYFAKIVLHDYVGGILGLTRDGSPWRLNLTQAMRQGDHEIAPTGHGGAVSCEFNTLYRWHSTTSEPDNAWISKVFDRLAADTGKPVLELTPKDFGHAVMKSMKPPADVRDWTFGGLTRGADGKFNDEALATIIYNATNTPAHAFGARSTPECMRVVEIMTIEQNRSWGTCTLNEFRKFFGLRPWKDFKEWNPDPEINEAAQALYGSIDNLELHIGLQAEAAKPAMPGAGLCPGYTVSRAILADAVVLTRSDRYLTTEMTPFNLTTWGYNFVGVDPKDGSYGGMFSKLLLRELPHYFKSGSGHSHFPLVVPAAMKVHLEKHGAGVANRYSWDMPAPKTLAQASAPNPSPALAYEMKLVSLLGTQVDRDLVDKVLFSDANLAKWGDNFAATTRDLIESHSIYNGLWKTKHIDIIENVVNLVPIRFLANEILGLPLKTEHNEGGIYRDQELYQIFVDISNYLLSNYEPSEEFALKVKAETATKIILADIEAHLALLEYGRFSVAGFFDSVKTWMAGKNDRSSGFLGQVLAAGKEKNYSHSQIAASLLAEVAAAAAPYSAALATIVDHYLDADAQDVKAGFVDSKAVRQALGAVKPRFTSSGTYLGQDGLSNETFFEATAGKVLGAIFSLPGVQRVRGSSGKLDRFTQSFEGKTQQFYIDNVGKVTPYPARLDVQYSA